jgi:hypothetical protein
MLGDVENLQNQIAGWEDRTQSLEPLLVGRLIEEGVVIGTVKAEYGHCG